MSLLRKGAIPDGVSDDDAVLLTDNFPTGYMAPLLELIADSRVPPP